MLPDISISTFLILCISAAADARPERTHNTIKWFPCKQNGSLPLSCGTLTVPLDYSNHTSNKTLELELVKVSAVKQPKKGSILINPGGPGESGRDFVAGSYGEAQLIATGGMYDLIGFDTRGTGNTIPFSCYPDPISREIARIMIPPYLNSSDTAVGGIWAGKTVLAEACYQNAKDVGQLIGTAFVARDMMQIVDALEEDGLLRYWGYSYGTALGATVAAMFPDRMDKIVLDGVLNPHEYYAGRDVQELTDSDATFAGFFEGCIANPEGCTLAKDGKTAEELSQKVYELMYKLKYYPIVAGSNTLTTIIDYAAIKGTILLSLYNTASWPGLANAFHGLLTGNLTAVLEFGAVLYGGTTIYPNNGHEAQDGIRCSDSSLRSHNLTTLFPLIEEFYAKSTIFGDIIPVTPLTCAQWPFQAKERYTGNFCVKTKNPILFIGNTFDPLTPLISAHNASSGFDGSVVLQHDGYGHTSLGQPSLCTAKAIRAYFSNGTLPAPGTKCEPSFPLFSNKTIADAFSPIANFTKRAIYEDDDVTLLAAMKVLGTRLTSKLKV